MLAAPPAVEEIDLRRNINWEDLLGFTPKQSTALDRLYSHRFILYGGARGGGKSRFLRWAAVDYLVSLYSDYGIKGARVGLFCETYPDLRDRQISKLKLEFPEWMGKLTDTKDQGLAFILSKDLGGGVIALRNLDDPTKYQSAEFAGIFVDELTKTTLGTFNILRGSLRWPGVAHTVFVGATNPGSIGHAWVKALWIDGTFPKEMEPLREQFAFIQSLPSDNKYLEQTYWDDLNTLPDDLRRAWVYGDWDVFQGQAFGAWGPQHVVDVFDIPGYWPRVIGIDWGSSAPFCALWGATNPRTGQIVIYRELYYTNLSDGEQARAIKLHSEGEHIRFRFADPSMWNKRAEDKDIITSTADTYSKNGVRLTKGDNDRLSGKRKVDRLLGNMKSGEPGVVVQKHCYNLIRTLPVLPYDTVRVEDVNSKAEDHAYDALRYLLSSAKDTDAETVPVIDKRKSVHPLYFALRSRRVTWR